MTKVDDKKNGINYSPLTSGQWFGLRNFFSLRTYTGCYEYYKNFEQYTDIHDEDEMKQSMKILRRCQKKFDNGNHFEDETKEITEKIEQFTK